MASGEMVFFSRPQSAAVKIVAPPAKAQEPVGNNGKNSPRKDMTQRQCRNILIYGSCKFQDKGCNFYHPSHDNPSPAPPESPVPTPALPAHTVNAPVFVPKRHRSPIPSPTSPPQYPPILQSTETHSSGSPSPTADSGSDAVESSNDDQNDNARSGPVATSTPNPSAAVFEPFNFAQSNQYEFVPSYPESYEIVQAPMPDYDTPANEMYYPTSAAFARQPLLYHLYTQPRSDDLELRYFVPDDIREELQRRSETVHMAPVPGLNLPEDLQDYHSLAPLEPVSGDRRKFGSWHSAVYRAVNSKDGQTYVLRRIENFRLPSVDAFTSIEAWRRIKHPNIVSVKEAFTTRAFGDSSLVVVYDYHPNATTLFENHVKAKAGQVSNGRGNRTQERIPERTLWSYIVQIASAVKAVHDAGLSVRVIDVTKVLITSKNRVRISSCGIVDVLMYEARQDISMLQHEDLAMFGKLISVLCCHHPNAANHPQKALDQINRNYSVDVKNLVISLMSKMNIQGKKPIDQVVDVIARHTMQEFEEAQNAVDRLEGGLMSELENGRLFRLLCKFGFINERPEFALDLRWSETGDRYIIKLFRDYVFHQVDEHGKPVVNLSHVLTCLNKLDAGTDERIMLVSPDEQSCLVVTYKEVKSYIESAFNELRAG
ncbi:hypothetical protein QCA50_008043 [Cerrena zonata]|uniref:PAN2-PAN3 deadenylation complex subunit PAN3 n=1 Tax=Cerrena zonata TaxID=2478898 RepID=A0AAW0GBI8_9APHY